MIIDTRLEGTEDDGTLCREVPVQIRVAEGLPGVITVTASTTELDRYNTIFNQDWDLSAFLRNPVILHMHDQWCNLPIGRGENIRVEGSGPSAVLICDIVFDMDDETAVKIYNKYKNNFMSAVSIRGRPRKVTRRNELPEEHWAFGETGLFYSKNRLVEISTVILGGNTEAIVTKRGAPSAGTMRKMLIEALQDPEIRSTVTAIALSGPVSEEPDSSPCWANSTEPDARSSLPWLSTVTK